MKASFVLIAVVLMTIFALISVCLFFTDYLINNNLIKCLNGHFCSKLYLDFSPFFAPEQKKKLTPN